jgi:hypothetical protein
MHASRGNYGAPRRGALIETDAPDNVAPMIRRRRRTAHGLRTVCLVLQAFAFALYLGQATGALAAAIDEPNPPKCCGENDSHCPPNCSLCVYCTHGPIALPAESPSLAPLEILRTHAVRIERLTRTPQPRKIPHVPKALLG